MIRPRHIAAAAPALLAAVFAGCGGAVSTGNLKGESRAVAQRIADFQTDATGGEAKKLCENDFARVVDKHLLAAGASCTQALKNQLGAIDNYELTVEAVSVTGKTATARVKSTWSGKTKVTTMRLVKEGAAWKITGLA
ncbi:MAG TPA: nuclear transport factor 2 family protein [Solirubrobacteraceae bacterium]|nr:nuclear transport factor 2 family protein [Solirubrobacteraceae bacterium]